MLNDILYDSVFLLESCKLSLVVLWETINEKENIVYFLILHTLRIPVEILWVVRLCSFMGSILVSVQTGEILIHWSLLNIMWPIKKTFGWRSQLLPHGVTSPTQPPRPQTICVQCYGKLEGNFHSMEEIFMYFHLVLPLAISLS